MASMFTISVRIQDNFSRASEALEAARRRALAAAGSALRRYAQTSMQRRKKPAAPGAPPSVHEGDLRQKILYAYDPQSRSEVIGPVVTRQGSNTPQRLEFGDHPYMQPALDKLEPDLPGYWANSVRS